MTAKSVALRRLARIVNGGTPTPEPDNWNGEVPWATPVDLGRTNGFSLSETLRNLTGKGASTGSTIAPTGSVLISTRAPIGYAAINNVPMAFNQGCKALIPAPGVSSSFLRYALTHVEPVLQSMGQGSTFLELSASALASVEIPFPSTEVQIQVVAFLDRETAQIDELLNKQERLIELLSEKRQATITHAITKGLDLKAPMKPSCIPGLGDIPAHWTDSRLKFALKRIEQGISPQADGVPASGGSWGVLKSGCVNGGVFRETENKQLPSDFAIDPAIAVKVGDLVVSRASGSPKLVGSAARVRSLNSRLILSDKTFRFVPAPHISVDFLELYLNSRLYRKQVEASISGAEGLANNISSTALRNMQLPLPPYSEQLRIAALLRRNTGTLAHLEHKARQAIELLIERRAALISAAVTGKIDVLEEAS